MLNPAFADVSINITTNVTALIRNLTLYYRLSGYYHILLLLPHLPLLILACNNLSILSSDPTNCHMNDLLWVIYIFMWVICGAI
jgi:hypothetical protein